MIMAITYTETRGFSAIAKLSVVCCCWREWSIRRTTSRLIAGVRALHCHFGLVGLTLVLTSFANSGMHHCWDRYSV